MNNKHSSYHFSTLDKMARAWRIELKLNDLLTNIAQDTGKQFKFDRSVLMLLEGGTLKIHTSWDKKDKLTSDDYPRILTIGQRVIQDGKSIFSVTAHDDKPSRLVYTIPLAGTHSLLGTLFLESYEKGRTLSNEDREFLDIIGRQASEAIEHTLIYQSTITDPLTSLFCHRHFQQETEQAVRQSARSGKSFSIFIMDLDHFKEVNDTYGHEVGNKILLRTSEILVESLRETDVVARFGGDEFEGLLHETGPKGIKIATEKIVQAIRSENFPGVGKLSCSIGSATIWDNAADAQDIFLRADEALYKSKEAGRDCATHSEIQLKPISNKEKNGSSSQKDQTTSPTFDLQTPSKETLQPISLVSDQLAQPSEKIDGHVIIKRLGIGSTSEVVLAKQPELDREVALKRPFNPHLSPDQIEAFEREAKITASLDHPGVVTVHSMGKDHDGRLYYTMRPISGIPLTEIILGRKELNADILSKFSLNRMLDILLRVSETMVFAHDQNVTHMDITPDNILVGEYGEVTVIDWSSSHCSDIPASQTNERDEAEQLIPAMPCYKSPEALSAKIDLHWKSVDVYSLGAILYEILTNIPPFQKNDIQATVEAIISGDLIPPDSLVPEAVISNKLSNICTSALNRDAKKRPEIKKFTESLGQYLRRESEWHHVGFPYDSSKFDFSKWTNSYGEVSYENGWLVNKAPTESMLIWNQKITGPYRFIAEGTFGEDGELALKGHTIKEATKDSNRYHGYCFQFGADHGTVTKLARNGEDVLVQHQKKRIPGKTYKIEISYDEDWLYCFIDNELIFSYRELNPIEGFHLGIYFYHSLSRIRPLKISYQLRSNLIPSIKVADDFRQNGYLETAIKRYQDVIENNQGHIESHLALLKIALCQGELGMLKESRHTFSLLKGSSLEPFALAENAFMEFKPKAIIDAERSLGLFKELIEKFPNSQARSRLSECANLWVKAKPRKNKNYSLEDDLNLRVRLLHLSKSPISTPASSQITEASFQVSYQHQLGNYQKALTEFEEFSKLLLENQKKLKMILTLEAFTKISNGIFDFSFSILKTPTTLQSLHNDVWSSSLNFQVALYQEVLPEFTKQAQIEFNKKRMLGTPAWTNRTSSLFRAHLAMGNTQEAMSLLEEGAKTDKEQDLSIDPSLIFFISYDTLGLSKPCCFDFIYKTYQKRIHADLGTRSMEPGAFKNLSTFMDILKVVAEGQALTADLNIEDFPREHLLENMIVSPRIIMALSFCVSIGIRCDVSKEETIKLIPRFCTGAFKEVCLMMLGEMEPKPSKKWPLPHWHPEHRMWLAWYLEASNRKDEARSIIEPCLDSRYGEINFQGLIKKLLSRI